MGIFTVAPETARPSTICGFIRNSDDMATAAWPKPRPAGRSISDRQFCTEPVADTEH